MYCSEMRLVRLVWLVGGYEGLESHKQVGSYGDTPAAICGVSPRAGAPLSGMSSTDGHAGRTTDTQQASWIDVVEYE